MTFVPIALGDAGVLAPGKWRWARALGWMIALFVMFGVVSGVPALAHGTFGQSIEVARIMGYLAIPVLYFGYAALVRWAERRPAQEVAPAPSARDLGLGLAIGLGLFTLVFATLRVTGAYTLAPGQWIDWPSDLLRDTGTGLAEELLARAIVFRLLMRALGLWPALIASSLLFDAAHLGNPNATWLSALAIAVEAGTLLAGFYLLTGRIWMSVGVHIAWNFAQGAIFGARVSGHTDTGSLFVSGPAEGAPDWLSGGGFGPEASLPAVVICLAAFVLTFKGAQRRGSV